MKMIFSVSGHQIATVVVDHKNRNIKNLEIISEMAIKNFMPGLLSSTPTYNNIEKMLTYYLDLEDESKTLEEIAEMIIQDGFYVELKPTFEVEIEK